MKSRDRVPHILRPNKSGGGPQNWIVIAVAALPVRLDKTHWQYIFRVGTCALWRRNREARSESIQWEDFTNAATLVEWAANRPRARERYGVVGHSLDYIAQVLDVHGRLPIEGFKLARAVTERGRWVQRWTKGNRKKERGAKTLLLIDLGNFFPVSLSELAIWLGMRKRRAPPINASDERWLAYCKHLAEIQLKALRAWIEFCASNDLGYFAPTIAGQAFNAFRHRFMRHQIFIHVHSDVIAIERAAHYGGRCQEFFRGRAPLHPYAHLDSSSNYGSILYDHSFPVRQVGHGAACSLSALQQRCRIGAVIALVTVHTDVPIFPRRQGASVCYPVGTFDTVLPTPELVLGIQSGYIREVHEWVSYETAPIFREYAEFFWDLRCDARAREDEFTAKVCKRFLTHLHGKLGQRIFTSRLVMTGADREDEIWTEYDIEDGAWYEYRSLAGRVEQRIREVQGRDTLVAIPAHVASYARVKLWEWITLAGFENVLYVDTDSLIVRWEALDRLRDYINPHKLGGLRLINQSRLLYIRAPKWYSFGRESKRAGVTRNASEIDWDQFQQDNIHSGRWALSHNFPHAAIVEEVKINAPYRKLLPKTSLGHWVPWVRAEEDAQ